MNDQNNHDTYEIGGSKPDMQMNFARLGKIIFWCFDTQLHGWRSRISGWQVGKDTLICGTDCNKD
jgi:hypothetical protein